ncbi:zinc ABC transporter substrate-binding protein ZnuA [Vibrio tapetis]|uniref:High-affinity zinc uptake system protein ZnuA n=1 Tax=Vibrio tapetis subsp. tapetis TaxID=1671868 RepID=A0A2N8ZBE0_9VIBR|nr:zinc ABC transporter substrate-binding protein ZnuA [Vibrio tapetis]SON49240.1 putative High-affinity zinc uptake system protein znuA [Vibrio tapetis subsp. tapetis]
MSRLSLLLIALSAVPAVSHATNVLSSVKPIQLIANEITEGVTQSDVLMSTNTSPHDYALKPSDVKKLRSADLVIWVGPDLETFLQGVLVEHKGSLNLSEHESITFRKYGGCGCGNHKDSHEGHDHDSHEGHDHDSHEGHDHDSHEGHDHDSHEGHDHDSHEGHDHDSHEGHDHDSHEGHDHDSHKADEHDAHEGHEGHDHGDHSHAAGSRDPHVWLGPKQAEQIAAVIASKLSEIDPENAAVYKDNLAKFKINLSATTAELQSSFESVKDKGYFVFHDAYGYYENYFGLNNLGHFTVSPERKPGAKTLNKIRKKLESNAAHCVFSEPQFTPAVVKSVTRGTDVNRGELDPLAIDITVQSGAYFDFLKSLGSQFETCLSE